MIQPVPGDDDLTLVALPLSFDGERPARIVQAPPAIGEHDTSFAAGERWRAR